MSDRRLFGISAAAAALTLTFAAVVFAGTLSGDTPAPPAPPALPEPVTAVAPAAPAVPPVPALPARAPKAATWVADVPAPPAPPRAARVPAPPVPAPPAHPKGHAHIHAGDVHARLSGETLVVESDGDAWVIEDPTTVRRFREAVRAQESRAREMEILVEKMAPTIEAAEEIARAIENDPALHNLEVEIDAEVDVAVKRALEHAESVTLHVEKVMKKHEASLKLMEKELEKLEKEMEALENHYSGDELEEELDELIEDARRKGLAKKID